MLWHAIQWICMYAGMKNSLKGAGYFLGAGTVNVSYEMALGVLLGLIVLSIPGPVFGLNRQLGRSEGKKVTLRDAFQMNYNINVLSMARMFLFGSRYAFAWCLKSVLCVSSRNIQQLYEPLKDIARVQGRLV